MKLLEKLRGLFGPRKKPGRPAGAKKPAPQKKPLKIAGPDAKLTAAEKRRVKRSIQKAQRDGKIPRDAVQTIPYRELFPDGLMQVNDKLFEKVLPEEADKFVEKISAMDADGSLAPAPFDGEPNAEGDFESPAYKG